MLGPKFSIPFSLLLSDRLSGISFFSSWPLRLCFNLHLIFMTPLRRRFLFHEGRTSSSTRTQDLLPVLSGPLTQRFQRARRGSPVRLRGPVCRLSALSLLPIFAEHSVDFLAVQQLSFIFFALLHPSNHHSAHFQHSFKVQFDISLTVFRHLVNYFFILNLSLVGSL